MDISHKGIKVVLLVGVLSAFFLSAKPEKMAELKQENYRAASFVIW